jgi:hypothetical protein
MVGSIQPSNTAPDRNEGLRCPLEVSLNLRRINHCFADAGVLYLERVNCLRHAIFRSLLLGLVPIVKVDMEYSIGRTVS